MKELGWEPQWLRQAPHRVLENQEWESWWPLHLTAKEKTAVREIPWVNSCQWPTPWAPAKGLQPGLSQHETFMNITITINIPQLSACGYKEVGHLLLAFLAIVPIIPLSIVWVWLKSKNDRLGSKPSLFRPLANSPAQSDVKFSPGFQRSTQGSCPQNES